MVKITLEDAYDELRAKKTIVCQNPLDPNVFCLVPPDGHVQICTSEESLSDFNWYKFDERK